MVMTSFMKEIHKSSGVTTAKESVKELREERHGDVIYSITVKKDTLPRTSTPPKSPSSGDVMMEKNTSRHLKGATLDHIIERLARVFVEGGEDANFLNVFLTTYRTFASPEELFTKLSDEYAKVKDESPTKNAVILRSIVRVLRAWLERYSQDDFTDLPGHQLLRRLLALAKEHDEFVNGADDVITPRLSPLPKRKNGFVAGAGFADYVAAKLAVAVKQDRLDKALASSLPSPTHSQDPRLDVTLEGTELNLEPATQLLYGLSSRYLAAQLTVIDAKLFHQVQPHHCLAAVASSKNRPATVQATIDQFNRVVYCVMATVLCPGVKLAQRTKILSRWIEVAQECRELKNFSSLRAIVSGLQTYAIHRLKKAWVNVPHSHANLLKELAELNMKDLLMKVGTAKVNTEDSSITRVRKDAAMRRHQDIHSGIVHGTVPYLGSFLTDLTYLDTARPDFLEGGLINFEKRREEFELLAQLQLLQASCRSYQHLEPDPLFLEWFQSYTVLTDDQTFKLSEIIEPPVSSVSSSAVHTSPLKRSISDKLFSIPYGRGGESDSESTGAVNGQKSSKKQENGGPKFSQSFNGRISTPSPGAQSRIVKVRLVRNHAKLDDGAEGKDKNSKDDVAKKDDLSSTCEYKTITISSNERTAAVIRKSLDLFMLDVEANAKRFSLVQILHDTHKEILIPDSANVFYAMSSSDLEPTLVLLEEGAEITTKVKRHQSTPHRAKKHRHRKNNSLSFIRDSESSPGRASSPMKSFYQIALGSVALVGGSYSPSMAARRSSDGEDGSDRTGGANSVVLLNKSGLNEGGHGAEMKAWHQKVRQMRASMSDASHLDLQGAEGVSGNRSFRCFSADYSSTVVLPVKVIRPRKALSSTEISPSKSAPCSPESQRRKGAKVEFSEVPPRMADCDVITATGRLIEWPRYSTSVYGSRSATWSSRRAIRRSKKPLSKSRFYTRETALKGYDGEAKSDRNEGRSKFYVDIETAEGGKKDDVTSPMRRSTKTLPSGFSPDFSGHDYDDGTYRNSVSLDSETKALPTPVPLSQWETPKRKLDSFASLSSTQSADAASSDSGSCISFVASPPEDNVFDDDIRNQDGRTPDVTPANLSPLSGDFAAKLNVSPKRGQLHLTPAPPLIKIQCASPESFLDGSRTPTLDASPNSDADSEHGAFHSVAQDSDQETSTYL